MKLCARTGPYQLFAQQRCWYLVLAMGCFTEDQTHWPVELTAFIKAIMLVSLLVFCNFPSLTIINNSTNLEHFRTLRPPHKGHPLLFQHDLNFNCNQVTGTSPIDWSWWTASLSAAGHGPNKPLQSEASEREASSKSLNFKIKKRTYAKISPKWSSLAAWVQWCPVYQSNRAAQNSGELLRLGL
jgi:hypothetical protein